MKTMIAAIALLVTVSVNAQSDKYADVMKKNLSMFDSAKTSQDFQNLSAAFERIGDAEKSTMASVLLCRACIINNGMG
jgi:hypothetical protein